MEIRLPKGVDHIIRELNRHGFEAYVVGGCIRDILLGLLPKDWDIATSANPEAVMSIFRKTVPTGIKHGTIEVMTEDGAYDVTTYRTEGAYVNKRYPSNVIFIDNLVEDLKRRDITINAMAYNTEKGLIDPFNGYRDLRHRLIRAVGFPQERFLEDALRILRAVRLAATLNFNIEERTFHALVETMDGLRNISIERIREELTNILLSNQPSRGIKMLFSTGVMKYVLPELMPMAAFLQFSPYHDKDVLNHTLEVLDATERNLPLRLAALFHDSGKPESFHMDEQGVGHFYGHEKISARITRETLTRLRYNGRTVQRAERLVAHHMVSVDTKNPYRLKKLLLSLGAENLPDLVALKRADYGGKPVQEKKGPPLLERLDAWDERLQAILDRKDPLRISDLALGGRDLLALGVPEGTEVGHILNTLLEKVLQSPELNEKVRLTEIVEREFLNDH